MKIRDKVALVTGGAQGIGLGIARVFLEAEAKVAVADRNEEGLKGTVAKLGKAFGKSVHGLVVDVSIEEETTRMVLETTERFGSIDILVNSAGFGGMNYFWEMSSDEWDAVINTNLRGTFLCTKEVVRFMLEKGVKGRIINIASLNSTIPTTGMAAYCASKGGVLMFTRVAALELGPRGINVNAIAPGTTLTPLTEWFYNLPGLKEAFLDHTPKGRFGFPEDIGKVALFLASEYADWVTGQVMGVDGGQSLLGLPRYYEGLHEATGKESIEE